MRRLLLLGTLLTGLLGCSATVESARLGPTYAPRPADAQVQFFSTRVPECPYDEIALVTAYANSGGLFSNMPDALHALQQRVRKLGGDAVVGLTQFPPSDEARGGVKGTAIHFSDPACHH